MPNKRKPARDRQGKGDAEPKDGVLRIYPPADGPFASQLADCTRAFARGAFGEARRLAREVVRGEATEQEKEFASQILYRTAIDPVAVGVGVGCFILFWLVALWGRF